MSNAIHPVWDVYDQLRTARLNVKYYGRRLAGVERTEFILEMILLVSAPSSAVAGLWFFDTDLGNVVWKVFTCIAAVTATLKPMLGFPRKIKSYETLLEEYRLLEQELSDIRTRISQAGKFNKVHQRDFQQAIQRLRALAPKNPERIERKSLKLQCQKEVLSELPTASFYVPQ